MDDQLILLEKARAYDEKALGELYDQYAPLIYKYLYRRVHDAQVAEDLTSDVFVRMLQAIQADQIWHTSFRGWLYRIAVNRVKDYYRKKQFKSLLGFVSMDEEAFHETAEMAVEPEAEGGISKKDFWRQIGQMLKSLSTMEKEVFLLRFFDQLTIKEMSAALNKNESTIKTHLYRALRKIKALAGDLDGLLEGI